MTVLRHLVFQWKHWVFKRSRNLESGTFAKEIQLWKNHNPRQKVKSSKITRKWRYITKNIVICVEMDILWDFVWLSLYTRCSARSQINFVDKESETCAKEIQLWTNHTSYSIIKVQNMQICVFVSYNRNIRFDCIELFVLFDFQWFSTSTRCSAGSRINFLGKESETCQNNFSSENTVLFNESA